MKKFVVLYGMVKEVRVAFVNSRGFIGKDGGRYIDGQRRASSDRCVMYCTERHCDTHQEARIIADKQVRARLREENDFMSLVLKQRSNVVWSTEA